MKKLLLIILILLPSSIFAGKGVAILFDNSGSMKQYFTQQMINDSKQAALSLLFKGTFDDNRWQILAQSNDYKNIAGKPLWDKNEIIYVHAFGECTEPIEPFFRMSPNFEEKSSEAEARRYFSQYLFKKLDFKDQWSYFDLAKYLCWWNVASQLGNSGKSYYMYVLMISDFIPDVPDSYAGIGDNYQNAFISNNAGETTLLRLRYFEPSPQRANVYLEIRLLRIGPHFLPPSSQQNQPSGDYILLTSPRDKFKIDSKTRRIKFSWKSKGNFIRYIFELNSQKPHKTLLKKIIDSTSEKRPANSLQVDARRILRLIQKTKTKSCYWFVKGVYSKTTRRTPIVSTKRTISIKKSISGLLWFLIIAILLVLAIKYSSKISSFVKNKILRQSREDGDKIKPGDINPDEEKWE